MNRIWRIKTPQPELSLSLSKSLGIFPITAQLLVNRGIKDEMQAQHFLYGDLASCHDGHLLKDGERAASRIKEAISKKENILLYGDYDADGITSVALMYLVLTYLKANVTTYIPNRLQEGYGLNVEAVKIAHRKKISLIITADCGISAHKEIELANELGIDVIVTDHHEIKSDNLPKAHSIINPAQSDCDYPFKHLSGVGLVYKLSELLLEGTDYPIEEHLDLVALGTVSDLSVQKGENRIMTKWGLKQLNETKNIGLKALIEVSGLEGKDISSSHIGYILGPRINAIGRLGSPDLALKLLLTNDAGEARRLAEILQRENRNRQGIESAVLDEALQRIEKEINFKESRVIILSGSDWHAGVIGIVASRIIDRFYRPTIMIALDGKIGKGSGRSIDGFHLFNAVNSCREHLIDFGGHEGACGLVIEKKNIARFAEAINAIAKREIAEENLYPALDIDMEVELRELSEKLTEELELLVPFGPENPKPIFYSRNVHVKNEPRRISKSGFKAWVTDDLITCEAVSFRANGMSLPSKDSKVSLVYSPSINTWQGVSSMQLELKDLRYI